MTEQVFDFEYQFVRVFDQGGEANNLDSLQEAIEDGWFPMRETPMGDDVLVLFARARTEPEKRLASLEAEVTKLKARPTVVLPPTPPYCPPWPGSGDYHTVSGVGPTRFVMNESSQ